MDVIDFAFWIVLIVGAAAVLTLVSMLTTFVYSHIHGAHEHARNLSRQMKDNSIRRQQTARVLDVLTFWNGTMIYGSELGVAASVSPAAVYRIVEQLIVDGWLEEHLDRPADHPGGRRFYTLTPLGVSRLRVERSADR